MTDSLRAPRLLYRPGAWPLGAACLLASLLLHGCGGSSSETPPPLEPLPERMRSEERGPDRAEQGGVEPGTNGGPDASVPPERRITPDAAGAPDPAGAPDGALPAGADEDVPPTWGR